jgi:hypothetical protein
MSPPLVPAGLREVYSLLSDSDATNLFHPFLSIFSKELEAALQPTTITTTNSQNNTVSTEPKLLELSPGSRLLSPALADIFTTSIIVEPASFALPPTAVSALDSTSTGLVVFTEDLISAADTIGMRGGGGRDRVNLILCRRLMATMGLASSSVPSPSGGRKRRVDVEQFVVGYLIRRFLSPRGHAIIATVADRGVIHDFLAAAAAVGRVGLSTQFPEQHQYDSSSSSCCCSCSSNALQHALNEEEQTVTYKIIRVVNTIYMPSKKSLEKALSLIYLLATGTLPESMGSSCTNDKQQDRGMSESVQSRAVRQLITDVVNTHGRFDPSSAQWTMNEDADIFVISKKSRSVSGDHCPVEE